ncbi:membrane protein [Parapedobacter pyrenivorans]|uniref:Membrane protein n=1 Tax=Parapedobacter pyrenivorans TaxID=1305674 RepID=A0A917M9Z5_9SPHI|nr:RagB/SusD family nutrient uptake outer membrane protein [Parapedobacter pyrenivorans]GGG87148.1 membrane protein [Parapedobacter pyrenivorans]
MKAKLYFLTGVAACSLAFQGCHDKLNVDLESAITANSMWQDEGDAKAAVYGTFNKFRSSFATAYIFWGEYRSGLWGPGLATNATYSDPFSNQLNSTHTHANWANLYTTINDCNLILKYTPNIPFTNESEKNEVLANALFVRAFCYYWIGRVWGDAPVLLNGFESGQQDDLYPSRESADRVFEQVGIDLEAARQLMPEDVVERDLASRAAINLLLADYQLWMAKVRGGGTASLNAAKQAVDQVLANSNYSLMSNFSSVFSSEQNQEIIFAWSLVQDEFTGGYPADFLIPLQYISAEYIENPIKVGTHQQWIFLTDNYKDFLSADDRDQRAEVSFETFFDAPKDATFQWINKYSGSWENQTRVFDSDIVVYRYADALLMSAEIENALGNSPLAIEQVNKVAERAYGVADFYANTLSSQQIDDAILNERKKEFVAEGKIWWDLIRFGVVFDEVPTLAGRENEQNVLLWPVHDSSINTNPNIKQTPGR